MQIFSNSSRDHRNKERGKMKQRMCANVVPDPDLDMKVKKAPGLLISENKYNGQVQSHAEQATRTLKGHSAIMSTARTDGTGSGTRWRESTRR